VLLAVGCGGGGGIGGVGAVFGRDNETHALYVREAPPGLGAEEAGILAGDQIVMIDGLYVRDLSEKEIRAKLRGEVGSKVALTILRGNDVHHVRVTRSERRAHEAEKPREQKIAE
jgi:C-terminal processing protease CtpA/Prc